MDGKEVRNLGPGACSGLRPYSRPCPWHCRSYGKCRHSSDAKSSSRPGREYRRYDDTYSQRHDGVEVALPTSLLKDPLEQYSGRFERAVTTAGQNEPLYSLLS